jgi:hypothetical protein
MVERPRKAIDRQLSGRRLTLLARRPAGQAVGLNSEINGLKHRNVKLLYKFGGKGLSDTIEESEIVA